MRAAARTGKVTDSVKSLLGSSNLSDGRKNPPTVAAKGKGKKVAKGAQRKIRSTAFPENAARAANPPENAARASRESSHRTLKKTIRTGSSQ